MEPVKGVHWRRCRRSLRRCCGRCIQMKAAPPGRCWFAQGLEQVTTVLSGNEYTGSAAADNLRDTPPLPWKSCALLERVCEILNQTTAIPCQDAAIVSHCPRWIPIPDCFRLLIPMHVTQRRGGKSSRSMKEAPCSVGKPRIVLSADSVRKIAPSRLQFRSGCLRLLR